MAVSGGSSRGAAKGGEPGCSHAPCHCPSRVHTQPMLTCDALALSSHGSCTLAALIRPTPSYTVATALLQLHTQHLDLWRYGQVQL